MRDLKCKCGSLKNYSDCCGIYINNDELPASPEQLMRARYTAYATANIDYVVKTMVGKPLDGFDLEAVTSWAKELVWLKLEVIATRLENDNTGFVAFKAYYREQNHDMVLHEISEFKRIDGVWFYSDGQIMR